MQYSSNTFQFLEIALQAKKQSFTKLRLFLIYPILPIQKLAQSLTQIQSRYHIQQMSKAIVVGSGISGLSAAKILLESNWEVTILEANDVLGGRLCTKEVQVGGKPFAFDHGASWMHGSCQEHPATQLSKQVKGLVTVQTDDENMVIYNSKGDEIGDEVDKEWQAYQQLTDKLQESALDLQSVEQTWSRLSANKLSNPVFMYHVANDVQFQTSASIRDLSAKLGADDEEFDGEEMLIVSGYQKFAQTLADQYKMQVLLKHRVVEIRYDEKEEESTVVCDNGKQFTADFVVVAVPLGVLKKKTIKFNPPLAQRKQKAIDNLAFGNVCKVLVTFNNGKFPTTAKQHYIGVVADSPNDRGLLTYFLNVWSVSGGLPALMTFGLGGNADQVQTMPQAQLKQLLAQRINAFADNPVTPADFSISRTAWRSNPSSFGAYPYASTTTQKGDWQEVCRPMFNEGWYFCGDHTTRKYRGTVHGAMISGEEAANCMVKEVKEDDWEYFDAEEGEEEQQEHGEEEKNEEIREERKEPEEFDNALTAKWSRRAKGAQVKGGKKAAPNAAAGAKQAPVAQTAEKAQCCSTM